MLHKTTLLGLLISALPLCGTFAQSAAQPQAGGVGASEPRFKAIRSISGSKGTAQGGRYIMEDPRTIFYIPQDKQVIVYFDWEGPLGPHKFEALWKNPEGRVAVITDFSYEARDKRFGGFFTLLLGDNVPTGIWTLEARVDGEAAGAHSFQVLAGERPPGEEVKPARVLLAPAQIYQRAQAGTVFVESYRSSGEKLNTGSGFVIGEDLIATAFQVIDGASHLQVVFPDGRSERTEQIAAWNRRQDWAIVKATTGAATKLQRAAAESLAVGDRCYSLDTPGDRTRVILDMDIIGKNSYPEAGERLNISHAPGPRSTGAPLLNEYGEVVGVIGGTLLPGSSLVPSSQIGSYFSFSAMQGGFRGALAVPIHLVSMSGSRTATLGEMAQGGLLTVPLTGQWNVLSGSLGRTVDKKTGYPNLAGETHEFSKKDAQFTLLMSWDPKEKRKGMVTVRFFDLNNRSLGASKPSKIDLKPGDFKQLTWTVPITTLRAGTYRLDVFIDNHPVWRTFFRMTE